jgi:hypothetical protein
MNTRETIIASASLQVTPVVDLWDLFYRCFKDAQKNPNLSIRDWKTSLTIDSRVADLHFVWGNPYPKAHIAVDLKLNRLMLNGTLSERLSKFHVDLAWVGEPKYRERPPKDIWMFAIAKALLQAQQRIKEANQ